MTVDESFVADSNGDARTGIDARDFMWPTVWEKEYLHRCRDAESRTQNMRLVVYTN
jgi:hypothetical protein